jgi:hypothetical protein
VRKLTRRRFPLFALAALAISAGPNRSDARDLGVDIQQPQSGATVLFVNGIRNVRWDAAASSEALRRSLLNLGLPDGTYDFDYFHNETEGLLGDTNEVFYQQQLGYEAFRRVGASEGVQYYRELGSYYNAKYSQLVFLSGVERRVIGIAGLLRDSIASKLRNGRGVVIVSHSQGNLYVEAAYAMILAEDATLAQQIRVVGVGSAAPNAPSGRYLTHANDRVIGALRISSAVYLPHVPLSANHVACIATGVCGFSIEWASIEIRGHGFREVYLNDLLRDQLDARTFPKIIYDAVTPSLIEVQTRDSDGDGVPDSGDLCPNVAGFAADGCPQSANSRTYVLRGIVAQKTYPTEAENIGITECFPGNVRIGDEFEVSYTVNLSARDVFPDPQFAQYGGIDSPERVITAARVVTPGGSRTFDIARYDRNLVQVWNNSSSSPNNVFDAYAMLLYPQASASRPQPGLYVNFVDESATSLDSAAQPVSFSVPVNLQVACFATTGPVGFATLLR